MKKLSKAKREKAEEHLKMAREFEDYFWHSWCVIEELLGVKMKATVDLEACTIDDLLKATPGDSLLEPASE